MTNVLEEFIPFSANPGMDDLCLPKLEERKERTAINRVYRQCPTMQYFTADSYEFTEKLSTEKCVKMLLHPVDVSYGPHYKTLRVSVITMVTIKINAFLRFSGHLTKDSQLHRLQAHTAPKVVMIMNEKSVRIRLEVAVEDTIVEFIYLETEENRQKRPSHNNRPPGRTSNPRQPETQKKR